MAEKGGHWVKSAGGGMSFKPAGGEGPWRKGEQELVDAESKALAALRQAKAQDDKYGTDATLAAVDRAGERVEAAREALYQWRKKNTTAFQEGSGPWSSFGEAGMAGSYLKNWGKTNAYRFMRGG